MGAFIRLGLIGRGVFGSRVWVSVAFRVLLCLILRFALLWAGQTPASWVGCNTAATTAFCHAPRELLRRRWDARLWRRPCRLRICKGNDNRGLGVIGADSVIFWPVGGAIRDGVEDESWALIDTASLEAWAITAIRLGRRH